MLMSVQKEKNVAESVVSEAHAGDSVYASLFEKINLNPVSALSALDIWQDPQAMSEASADERLTAGMQVFMECLAKTGTQVEKLDKALIDHHIAELDYQISRQLDAVLHHPEFQKVESLWRGVKSLVDKTDFRRNVKIELLDLSKDDLRQDFEDAPEIIQSGLYLQTYVAEYDTPGGEPIAALVSAWEFDASAQDVALLKNISRVAASAHMPFIGSVGPAFFQKETMEEVAAIKDIGNHFERAEYIKWNAFRETDDARYIGLVMPRVLGRLPYGPDTRIHTPFLFTKEIDSSSPYLYKAVTTGQTLKSAEFKWYKINDAGQEVEYFNTKLENVKVVKVNPVMHDIKNPTYEKHNHLEQVELRYEKITWTYKDGNIIHSDAWSERTTA
ncbi:type VI secretion system contractile sheath large subunit [Escherichia coli]|uniref:type VI secretion system contractile sheath large subunit n=5 Tax=Escherichia TaxID=561 RepID=UPI000B7EDF60|nr:type VI secretion system contractile sheath large subunit [Escherichia coli]EHC4982464.1 type VI secretion system contractile sheath large subunit [Escherichia coli]MBC0836245.1 type VI secretion system contractile sheath large subunit [Escherichia coli]HAH9222717.1 type VI secretion system contractile sheath large subunit [Escherichia coli]